jgi:Carboxypeptidase regulatory-like domain
MMTEQELEIERLEIERERLQIDKEKAAQEKRFWARNFATIVTTIVSLAAVLVTLGQVWMTNISKEKEIAIAREQKEKELSLMQAQKEKELTLLVVQQDREWNLNAAKFVSEHANVIFGKDKAQRERIAKVMIVTFPPSITDALFQKLETIPDSSEGQTTWRSARVNIIPKIDDSPSLTTNINYGSLIGQFVDVTTNEPIKGARVTINNRQVTSLNFQTTTDANGHFQMDSVPAVPLGSYSLTASHPDYETKRQFVSVIAGAPTTISVSAPAKKQSP